ncbi:helix-turn-helix transcriptional regulator [Bacillus sp. FJAT-49736]|uniref:helix-turn-helix domain-containing protein n=1 Tax=Bacillus sp. FJAT-49736 TaxID=2833582 RepID=UPI001BC8FAA7|nr:helix-turn-helix transcriptional regulator [Bacillus sp. FJAT-49736]
MVDNKEFGQYIKELRENNGYSSQRSFASMLGVSNATVARIERGEVEASIETLQKMAKFFNLNYLDLMDKQTGLIKTQNRSESLYVKIKMLKKDQIDIIASLVDEFLKLEGKI